MSLAVRSKLLSLDSGWGLCFQNCDQKGDDSQFYLPWCSRDSLGSRTRLVHQPWAFKCSSHLKLSFLSHVETEHTTLPSFFLGVFMVRDAGDHYWSAKMGLDLLIMLKMVIQPIKGGAVHLWRVSHQVRQWWQALANRVAGLYIPGRCMPPSSILPGKGTLCSSSISRKTLVRQVEESEQEQAHVFPCQMMCMTVPA